MVKIIRKVGVFLVIDYMFNIDGNTVNFPFEVEEHRIEDWFLNQGMFSEREFALLGHFDYLEILEEKKDEIKEHFYNEAVMQQKHKQRRD